MEEKTASSAQFINSLLFESPFLPSTTTMASSSNLAYLCLLLLPLSFLFLLYLILRSRPTKIPIKSRHVFITGGSCGIGLALFHAAAQHGASRVSLLARDLKKLEMARESLSALFPETEVVVYSADVRQSEEVRKAVESAGPIDVLICNHGVFVAKELEGMDLDEVKRILDINLMGTFNVIKAGLSRMKSSRLERGLGSIAIMSSQAGQIGVYGYTAYSTSKFGLRGLAEALQQEVIADNIHVSLIFPPDTDTPGLVEDNKIRPALTRIMAASSGMMKADEVAKKALKGIQSASFGIPCNFEGHFLSIATAGLSPQRSVLMAFLEVTTASMLRIVALFFQWNWYATIDNCHQQKK